MRIFSSFDTKLKEEKVNYYKKVFGEEHVLVLTKSKLYLAIFVSIPITVALLLIAAVIYGIYTLSNGNMGMTFYIGIPASIIIMSYVMLRSVLKNYIDYTMDFCIITPQQVEKFDQTGILQRDVQALGTRQIKSVYVNKKGLLYSMFNNGKITFMSEGDSHSGEIQLYFIAKPEIAKKKIDFIIKSKFTDHSTHSGGNPTNQ